MAPEAVHRGPPPPVGQTAVEAISNRMKPKQSPGSLELFDVRLAQRLHSPFHLARIMRQNRVDNSRSGIA